MSVRYGGVVANEDVSFEVFPGEIVGLIGPNGAGKTTLIDAVSGYARATGSVALLGRKLDGRKPFRRSRDGLGRTFQGIELYDDLSVRENVEVGTTAARSAGAARARMDRARMDRARADRVPSPLGIDAYFHILGLQDVCDRIVVLDLGKVVAVGSPADIVGNDQVKRAYLGTTHAGVESAS